MARSAHEIESLDPFDLDADTVVALNDHLNRVRHETDPTLPGRPIAELEVILTQPPEFQKPLWWIVREGREVIGHAYLHIDEGLTANHHLAELDLVVDRTHRRAGIGTRLFEAARAATLEHGRPLLFMATSSLVPSGDAFAASLGAELGLTDIASRLELSSLDRSLMEAWASIGGGLAGEYVLVQWDGPIPDADLHDVVALRDVMNDAPTEDLDFRDEEMTPERLREFEAYLARRQVTRWMLAVRHVPSGRLAGYTEMFFNPNLPDLGQQGDTGVFPEFRGRSLGRWLKGTMILRVLDERPGIRRISTDNAGSNAPMLAINREMGFVVHEEGRIWQLDVGQPQPR